MDKKPRSRPVTSTAAFLLTAAGQLLFLSKSLRGGLTPLEPVLYVELFSCILIVAAAIFTANPKGWRGKTAVYTAVVVYLIYAVFNLYEFSFFKVFYLSAIVTEYQSYGAAIEALKLVLLLVGIVAAIPVMPAPTGREYARALENAARRQQTEWAKASIQGAQADLKQTVESLRENMPPEQLAALMEELKTEPDKMPEEEEPVCKQKGKPESEEWKGWGCG